MVREHDWGGLVEWDGDQAADPGCIIGECVSRDVQDVAWEA